MSFGDLGMTAPIIALVVPATAILVQRQGTKWERNPRPILLSVLALVASFICVLALKGRAMDHAADGLDGLFRLDGLAVFVDLIYLLAAFLTVLFGQGYLKARGRNSNEFYALVLFACAGMMVMTSTSHLVSIFLGLEILSISFYVLAGLFRDQSRSIEAAAKYFLVGSFASAVLLFGIALVYGATGHLDLYAVGAEPASALLSLGLGLVLVGFLFKVAAVPFHMWAPDVYEGAPTPVTGYMATAVKAAAFTAFLRAAVLGFSRQGRGFEDALYWVAIATMTAGNVAALAQASVKRMLAYSSIAHAGYVLAGIVALSPAGGTGVQGVLFYLLAYAVMNLGAFGVLAALESADGKGLLFDDMAGLRTRKPALALALSVFMISLAGIPPTAGFMAKFTLFGAVIHRGIESHEPRFVVLATFGILNSLLSLYYYLRVPIQAYMKPLPEGIEPGPAVPGAFRAAIFVTFFLTLWLGMGPSFIGLGLENVMSLVQAASATIGR